MNEKLKTSARLRIKVLLPVTLLSKSWNNLQLKPDLINTYKDYLLTIHAIIRASVPLMQCARQKSSKITDDTLATILNDYFTKHISEEMNHDDWLLDDLESIGISRKDALLRKPSPIVAELVGSQYYWIFHWHPICLLGYIAILEGYPPKRENIDLLQKNTGLPSSAFRTLMKHGDIDPFHRTDLNDLIDRLQLNTKHEEWITLNAMYTAVKCSEILESL
jgi:hypothetical protein